MKASEAAAEAIAVVAARHETCDFPGAKPCARCASLGAKALAVVMPDGRTVAQWLDAAEKDRARMLAQGAEIDRLRAEVAKLRAVADAADNLAVWLPPCDDRAWQADPDNRPTCSERWPDDVDEWCVTCCMHAALAALEADR